MMSAAKQELMPLPTARNRELKICVIACGLAIAVVATIAATYHSSRLTELEERHRWDRHRDCARVIMWLDTRGIKSVPPHMFDTWLPIAVVSNQPDGSTKYGWTNFTSVHDGHGWRDGEAGGGAWIVKDSKGNITNIDYHSYP